MLDRVRGAAVALVVLALIAPSLEAAAAESEATAPLVDPATSRRGVGVIAIGDGAADATWPVALAIYGEASLRPRIEDRDARALAGGQLPKDAPKATAELAELRAQVRGDDTASRLLLKEIARRTAAVALVLVWPKTDAKPTEARIYDAAGDVVEPTLHREGTAGWDALVGTLRGRYAKVEPATTPTTTSTATTPGKDGSSGKGSSVLKSPWFWGAVALAVAGAVVWAATSSRGSAQATGLRVEWGK